MKEVFLSNSLSFITKYNSNYSEEDIEKIKYGLEGLYLTITKLTIILLLAILFGIIKELILTLIFFNIIRYPAFGVHADKSSICLISSIILILGSTLLLSQIDINPYIKIVTVIFSFFNYLLFAPADTIKRPLTNAKKRKYRKIASCIIALIYIVLIFTTDIKIISNAILAGLLIEAIMINPITYKLLNMPFNNYKKLV